MLRNTLKLKKIFFRIYSKIIFTKLKVLQSSCDILFGNVQ